MKRLIIVPAFNEAKVIFSTLKKLKSKLIKSKYKFDILVIDDGSQDSTSSQAKKARVKVIRHSINRGLGGALGTGLEYAKRNNYDLAVTFDADGQHYPQDVITATNKIETVAADVVIGSRTISTRGHMPWDRKIINWVSNFVTLLLFRIWTTDSQSGFRAFSKKAINCIQIKTERMEVSSEIFSEIKKNHLKLVEIPIKVIYTKYSRNKGQTNLNAVNVLYKLLLRLAR